VRRVKERKKTRKKSRMIGGPAQAPWNLKTEGQGALAHVEIQFVSAQQAIMFA
jgi:hypothetical protein